MASARAAAVARGASTPTLSSTISDTPPEATPTSGRPQAIASSATRPKGSLGLAWRKASQLAIRRATSRGSRS